MQGISTVIGSTGFEDLERDQFVDEELWLTTAQLSATAGAHDHLFEQEVSDDEFEQDVEFGPTRWAGQHGVGGVRHAGRR